MSIVYYKHPEYFLCVYFEICSFTFFNVGRTFVLKESGLLSLIFLCPKNIFANYWILTSAAIIINNCLTSQTFFSKVAQNLRYLHANEWHHLNGPQQRCVLTQTKLHDHNKTTPTSNDMCPTDVITTMI